MRGIILLVIAAQLFGCTTPAQYTWQDTRQPARDDATADLEICRTYAAKQYRAGMPKGEPYLTDQANRIVGTNSSIPGEWRADRSPFPTTNINAQPVHEVPVVYTGYPGELDYFPSYLDEILEKCMLDRGWVYQPVRNE